MTTKEFDELVVTLQQFEKDTFNKKVKEYMSEG